ncbi:DUF2163 domain-containing protein [Xanthobacter sp. TB0139]|uniref:DUF2163 domain-containing protein n=1 Tax=Xanthobacter sp. TB0139 TaxID=3459178 RepID=UPI00403A631E
MRAFDSETLALLASGRMVTAALIQFDFGTGTYGFWSGAGRLEFAGLTYLGAGGLIGIEDVTAVGSLESASLTLTLTAIANTALTPDTLAGIEAEHYHGRPVTLRRAYTHPETRALVAVERLWRGYVSQITHDETIGGEAVLAVTCESRGRDVTRKGYRVWSVADQLRIDAADGGLRHAAVAGRQTAFWGRAPGSAS